MQPYTLFLTITLLIWLQKGSGSKKHFTLLLHILAWVNQKDHSSFSCKNCGVFFTLSKRYFFPCTVKFLPIPILLKYTIIVNVWKVLVQKKNSTIPKRISNCCAQEVQNNLIFGGEKILSGLVCILWETFLVPILLQHACS